MARNYFLINELADSGRCPICGKNDSGVFTEEASDDHEFFAGVCPACSTHLARATEDVAEGCKTMRGALESELPRDRAARAFEFLKDYYQYGG